MFIMECKFITDGICSKDFNCEYFKFEQIHVGIDCFYRIIKEE